MQSTVTYEEVFVAINKLKAAKNDGAIGLSSDYFKHSCDDLAVYICLLFTALLVHGTAPSESIALLSLSKGQRI